ncbi:helix-turn-helix domain-containing protein [Streptomyces sp. NPDC049099]|uniref:helix-turn-helix domain-containing protein n=1 Tax=Streptomyces sp. NPDC049099 TaxID=3155768 RepID=UPI00342A3FF5
MTPGERAVECERLAEALRGLRARTGLSLAALAAKTPYSKSSWDRYLRGGTVPPRQAVAALCELADEDPGRILALWELADTVASGRAAGGRAAGGRAAGGDASGGCPCAGEPSAAVAEPPPSEDAGRSSRRRAGGLLAVLAGGGLAIAAVAVTPAATGAFSESGASASPSPSAPVPVQGCHGDGCTGKDPETYGCGAAPVPVTLGRRSFPGPTVVKIRHSTACGAVWARIDLGKVGDRAEILVPHHAPWRTEVKDGYDARDSLSTPMVAASRSDLDHVRACLVREGRRHCFGPRE